MDGKSKGREEGTGRDGQAEQERAPPPACCCRRAAQDRKKGLIVKLLVAARNNEAGYIMRALQVGGPGRLVGGRAWVACGRAVPGHSLPGTVRGA